jgi:hypothetical protein
VWNDDEFSQHELQLESKMAIRDMIERNAPSSKKFFTECLKLPNAGINEMLGDLRIMQERKRSDIKRIHRLYGRIQSLHHIHAEEIKYVLLSIQAVIADLFEQVRFQGASPHLQQQRQSMAVARRLCLGRDSPTRKI